MSDNVTPALVVTIKELPSVHVGRIVYQPEAGHGDLFASIHGCFLRLQTWARGLGLDAQTLLHIGIPNIRDGQLADYACCIEVPERVASGLSEISIQELPGGRYAVLSMIKEPAIIGSFIGRFYQEYIPQNNIGMDGARPTYEIYYENTMEYCVPIV